MKKFRNRIVAFGRPAIVLSTVRCLQGTGMKADVVVVGGLNELVKWSRHTNRYYSVKSEEEGLCLIEHNYSQDQDKPILISCNDSVAELVDANRERLEKHFIISSCKESSQYLSYWMRKDTMGLLAKQLGFNVPKFWTVDLKGGTVDMRQFVFPCITKALKSSRGQKNATKICRNQTELENAIEHAKQYTDLLLVQEFIQFDQGYCTLGVRLNNSKKIIVGRTGKRFRSNLQMYGYPTFSRLERELPPSVDEKIIKTFVEKTGYTGLFSFETIVAGDKTYFVEINFRTDGKIFGMPATGCNIVADWLYDAVGYGVFPEKVSKDVYVMFGPEDFRHVMAKDISFGYWLKDVFRTDCFHTWCLHDPLPFCVLCLKKMSRIFFVKTH